MQIVICIPDCSIPQNNGLLELQLMCFRGEICQCSFPFKVLPKGHGRLIDENDLTPVISVEKLAGVPTIVEAESEG